MRTEGSGPGRDALAVGLGFFIGCTPFYGFHLLLVLALGWLLRLNRLKMYIAANVSNPLFAPFLILLEIQTGAWLRRGEFHALTIDAIRTTDPWTFGFDLLLGSVVVGLAGGLAIAAATAATSRRRGPFDAIAAAAADRYLSSGIVAWEFARGKLRGDPIYRKVAAGHALRSGGVLVDIGCGQGLMLAVLTEARQRVASGNWPEALPRPPVFDALIGVELRPRIARIAARALDGDAEILCADANVASFPTPSAVLLFDVLHLMPPREQEALLRMLETRLAPDGVLLVREADAAGGSAFHAVRLGNRLKAIVTGNWRQRFAYRSAAGWTALFRAAGFEPDVQDMSAGTPFANVLFTLRPTAHHRS